MGTKNTKDVFVGVDIGGTFTDIVLRKPEGTVIVKKVPSTPDTPEVAILTGIKDMFQSEEIDPSKIKEFIHGTTVATNTILEQKGAKTGMLCTEGFRDVLEIARVRTPTLFDLTWDKPDPLVKRQFRLEVEERTNANGEIIKKLNRSSVIRALDKLVDLKVESIAVSLINSYMNANHEREIEQIIKERYPNLPVSCSYQVLPEIKEYERTSTTAVNAYVLPKVKNYLYRLKEGLKNQGIVSPLLIVASNGGVVSVEDAANYPAKIVASGPAAGVTGAAKLLENIDMKNAITFDMGGTTAKASVIENYEPLLTTEYEVREGISTSSRFIKAGGYLLKVPAVDIAEVGSGGGSIAWIDKGGSLQVGPTSAGSDPGPVCYDKGGEEPTITDANLVLGYLPATLGDDLPLNMEKAKSVIDERIAKPLGLSIEEAALGIRQIANANMTRAVRAVTVEKGQDPRDSSIVAFGGNGGVHGVDIAKSLDIPKVIIPKLPGVFSAAGLLACDVQYEYVLSDVGLLNEMADNIQKAIGILQSQGISQLEKGGYQESYIDLTYSVDVRYKGQSSELNIVISASDVINKGTLRQLENDFRKNYEKTFGHETGEDVEVVNIRLTAKGLRENVPNLAKLQTEQKTRLNKSNTRLAYFNKEAGYVSVEVLDRDELTKGKIIGPVIVESYDSTIVVPHDTNVYLDKWGNVVVDNVKIKELVEK